MARGGGRRAREYPPRRYRGTPPKRGCVLLPSLEGWPKAGVGAFSHHTSLEGWPGLWLVSWTVDVWNSIVALWQARVTDAAMERLRFFMAGGLS